MNFQLHSVIITLNNSLFNIINKLNAMYDYISNAINLNINYYCYCGCILEETAWKLARNWTCFSCYKLMPQEIRVPFACCNNECIYKKIHPQQCKYVSCTDCVHRVNDLKDQEINENDDDDNDTQTHYLFI